MYDKLQSCYLTKRAYDAKGRLIEELDSHNTKTVYTYDGLNRLTKKETTNGENRSIFRTYYDFRNNVVSALDAENNKTEYSYNLRGFLTDVRQYSSGTSGQETEYSYDGEGNISSLATGAIGDSNKHIYQFELDALGRCIKETDPMGGIHQYAYETDGNLSQSIDKNGVVTSYTYDGLGRLIKEENSTGGTLCYTYNGFDEVTSVTDGNLSVKTSYNDFGEAVKIIRDKSEEGFTYDCAGRVINHTITDKDIDTITSRYSYDALGRTTAIETAGGSEYISYDTAGRISEKSYPQTGVVKKYTYYKDSTLKSLLTYVDDKLTTAENIEYDRNGNKTLWEQDGKITSYTYDGMNRLQGAKESSGVLTEYEFDSFGNISREYTLTPSGIKTKQHEYDANNRLLLSFDDNSSTRYTYDNNGNLINKIYELSGRETESYYSYDGYNRLSEYISGNTTAEYSYNPEGLRESKTVNGKYTRFIYDGENIVGELTDDNYYIYYRGTELIGAQSYDNNNYYYKLDSHGNVTDLLTHTSEVIKSYTYNPYGKEKPFAINPSGNETIIYHWKNETENTHNPFRYCGEYYDEESGLIYLRNRYYDPSIGRFITEDPARDGNNWYVYCSNNPVNLIDPLGLFDYDDRLGPSTEYNIDVKVMQNELAWLGYYSGEIDGYFGQKTLDAVNAYKNAMGLGNTGSDWGVVGKQTWESMGLTYRTKADIDSGVEIATIGLKQYKDFSAPINDALNDAAVAAEGKWRFNYKWFKSQVNHKKPWDIKRESPWNQTIGADTYPGWGVKVMYNNALMTPEELGNYTYGYIGAALGLTTAELYAGSWYAAGFPIGGDDWANEYNDWNSIKKGVNAYK